MQLLINWYRFLYVILASKGKWLIYLIWIEATVAHKVAVAPTKLLCVTAELLCVTITAEIAVAATELPCVSAKTLCASTKLLLWLLKIKNKTKYIQNSDIQSAYCNMTPYEKSNTKKKVPHNSAYNCQIVGHRIAVPACFGHEIVELMIRSHDTFLSIDFIYFLLILIVHLNFKQILFDWLNDHLKSLIAHEWKLKLTFFFSLMLWEQWYLKIDDWLIDH